MGLSVRVCFVLFWLFVLSVCLSYLSVCMSVCLFVCLSTCMSVYLSVSVCPSVCLYVCLLVCLSVYLSVCMSVCLSIRSVESVNNKLLSSVYIHIYTFWYTLSWIDK